MSVTTDEPRATTASLAGAGWSVLSVEPGLGVADAWATVAGSRTLLGAR